MKRRLLACLAFCLTGTAQAQGIPVIDMASIKQLVTQITYWQKQLQAMSSQLYQAQAAYAAITGGRGMEAIAPLSNIGRNYLPPDYAEMARVVNSTSTMYSGISNQVRSIQYANAVLSKSKVGGLSPQQQKLIQEGRQAAALLQTIAQQGQSFASQRMAPLQQMNGTIANASDAKAIADLQARIASEQTMLTADQTKLQAMYQLAQAQELGRQQAVRETVITSFGTVSTAQHPTFP